MLVFQFLLTTLRMRNLVEVNSRHRSSCSINVFCLFDWVVKRYPATFRSVFLSGVLRNPRVVQEVARDSVRDCDWIYFIFFNFACCATLVLTAVGIFMHNDSAASLLLCCCCKHCKTWIVQVRSKLYRGAFTFFAIFMQGVPKTWKLFQGFLQGEKVGKGYSRRLGPRVSRANWLGIVELWFQYIQKSPGWGKLKQ